MFEVIARVFKANDSEVGSLVELSDGETSFAGKVSQVSENEFVVDWSDGARSIENKSDYELVVNTRTAAEEEIDGNHSICPFEHCEVALKRKQEENHARGKVGIGVCSTNVGSKFFCSSCAEKVAAIAARHEDGDHTDCEFDTCSEALRNVQEKNHARGKVGVGACSLNPASKFFCASCAEKVARSHGRPLFTAGSITASENPAQPAGWAVAPVDADAYPNQELMAIEMQKRNDTAGWEDAQNRQFVDGNNPAQPAGWAVPMMGEVEAKVYSNNLDGEEGLVEVSNGVTRLAGKVMASDDDSFIVEWEDARRTVESKDEYELIIEADGAISSSSQLLGNGE